MDKKKLESMLKDYEASRKINVEGVTNGPEVKELRSQEKKR